MDSSIPRGIQAVLTKKGKSKVIVYRIRIQRKDLSFDKYYEDLEEAKNDLKISKLKNAQEILNAKYGIEGEKMKDFMKSFIADNILNPPLKFYAIKHIAEKYEDKETDTFKIKRQKSLSRSFINTILDTEVVDPSIDYQPGMIAFENAKKRSKIGDINPSKLNQKVINDYCLERRRKGIKAISIKRELIHFSSLIKFLNRTANFEIPNFVLSYDQTLLRTWHKEDRVKKPVETRLSQDEWNEYWRTLDKAKNPDLKRIVIFSLLSAMRKNEVVDLRWEQIDFQRNKINLPMTKNGKPRSVMLTDQAKQFLIKINTENKTAGKVFFYKNTSAFDGSYKKVMSNSKVKVNFHKMRKEAISAIFENLGSVGANSNALLAKFLGMRHMDNFMTNYVLPNTQPSLSTENEALRSIGHSSPQVTVDHYLLENK